MNKFKKINIFALGWNGLFIIVPLVLMTILSFSTTRGFSLQEIEFSLSNFSKLTESFYFIAFKNSLKYSFITTFICLLIGYPTAFILSKSPIKNKNLLLILIILPSVSNLLLRVLAWEKSFAANSILNYLGISLNLLGTDLAIIIGMVSIYLPFMILPIYSSLEKVENSVLDAAKDLGATKLFTFKKVILPLTVPGIISGIVLTLLPSATTFVIPLRLGNGKVLLIGNIIEQSFKKTFNFNMGSLISLILMILILSFMVLIFKYDREGETL